MKIEKFAQYIQSPVQYGRQNKRRILLMVLIVFFFVAATVAFFVYQGAWGLDDPESDIQNTESAEESATNGSTVTTDTTASTAAVTSGTAAAAAPVDEPYYDDACFIGDSRSEGFMQYSGPAKATYYVYKGLTVDMASKKAFVNDNGNKVTVVDALKKHRFGKIYIMLGINELGWQYSSIFYDKYSKLIDTVKSEQPDAKLFIQSIFPVTAARSAKGDYVNNQKIQEYNTLIKTICAEKQLYYLNIGEALLDENGELPDAAAYDGVHLKKPYCDKWRAYLDTHINVPIPAMPETTVSTTVMTTAETVTSVITDNMAKLPHY